MIAPCCRLSSKRNQSPPQDSRRMALAGLCNRLLASRSSPNSRLNTRWGWTLCNKLALIIISKWGYSNLARCQWLCLTCSICRCTLLAILSPKTAWPSSIWGRRDPIRIGLPASRSSVANRLGEQWRARSTTWRITSKCLTTRMTQMTNKAQMSKREAT